ncbi:MAG TPA: cupin domain-containing protein [Mycobacterium sp.]
MALTKTAPQQRSEDRVMELDDEAERLYLREKLHEALAPLHLRGLWQLPPGSLPTSPTPVTQACHWRASDVIPLAHQATEVITADGERRAVLLTNPALGPTPFTTTTIQGAVQCLPAHETVAAHRHTPAAIRFILRGAGSYTTVGGVKCEMAPGHFIFTPNWSWHDHTNPTDDPVVWFDGLDIPIVTRLETLIFEDHPDGVQKLTNSTSDMYRTPWEDTDRTLTELFDDPTKIASVQFTDPITGGAISPTLDCWMRRLGPALTTHATRKTGNSIFVVFSGTGETSVGRSRFEWEAGDVFVAPSWAVVDHRPYETSNLFEMTDRPILEALGLFRYETLEVDALVEVS